MTHSRHEAALDRFSDEPRNGETRAWQALLGAHGVIFSRLNRAISREFGITLAKFDVLAQLFRAPDGLTQSDLSRQLKVTGGNVTGLVQRLAADGLIRREVASNDRRAFLVHLTPQGREVFLAVRARHDKLIASYIGPLGDESLAGLTDLLWQTARVLAKTEGTIAP